jgi:hypothetical protein
MMLDWLYRLIHFRQRRIVVLRLRSSFSSAESGRLIKHKPGSDVWSSVLTSGANRR